MSTSADSDQRPLRLPITGLCLVGLLRLLDAVLLLAQRRQVGHQEASNRVAEGAVELLDVLEGHGVAQAQRDALERLNEVRICWLISDANSAMMSLADAAAQKQRQIDASL